MESALLVQTPRNAGTIYSALYELVCDCDYTRMRGAVAFASASGVSLLAEAIEARRGPIAVSMVVGLDGSITEPEALEKLNECFPNSVRCLESSEADTMFHAKVLCFDDERRQGRMSWLVGSSNLTRAGLVRNREGGLVVKLNRGEAHSAREGWQRWWRDTWNCCEPLNDAVIAEYVRRYSRSRRRLPPDRKGGPGREHRGPELGKANELWLQVGLTGGSQNQFEIPLEVVSFFGVRPTGHDRSVRMTFNRGDEVYGNNIIAYYPHNSMWRIRLDTSIPEVWKRTLRDKFVRLLRTDSPGAYDLTILDSAGVGPLRAASESLGTVGETRTRTYGWL